MSAETKAAAGGSSKQAELAKSIADAVEERIQALMLNMAKDSAVRDADRDTTANSILARLETVESLLNGQKRPVKAERKTGGAGAKKASGGKKDAGGDERDRVKNSMLYFRWAFANDEGLREEFLTDDAKGILETEDFSKKSGDELYKAQGAHLWKKCLTDEQKKDVKERFQQWEQDRKSATDEPQLDGDEGAGAGANGEADGVDDGSPDTPAPTEAEAPPAKPAVKAAPKVAAKAAAPKAAAKAAPKAAAPKAGAKAPAKKA